MTRTPPPGCSCDEVPSADVVRTGVAGLPDLLRDLPGGTRDVVPTPARVRTTLATGEVGSQDAAAGWALPRPAPGHRPVLAHARQLHLTRHCGEETWPDGLRAQVRPPVDAGPARIDELRPR
ncbi:DUF4111 domain-containing protein [Saccharothrix sp. BKS2]|uniref:aminoglycoside adenylyltransferase domain-containing protein n=1 Tax=Saccharothrix sp. BKS2 TaxID=3064400 RepID=UPI0039EC7775